MSYKLGIKIPLIYIDILYKLSKNNNCAMPFVPERDPTCVEYKPNAKFGNLHELSRLTPYI